MNGYQPLTPLGKEPMTTFKPSDQSWAYLYVITGAAMIILFKHFGIDGSLGAGVLGAGLQAYTTGKP